MISPNTRAWVVSFSLFVVLSACSYSEQQDEVYFGAFLPTQEQLSLSVADLPGSLSVYHMVSLPVDEERARELGWEHPLDRLSTEKNSKVSLKHDRIDTTSLTNDELNDVFDPFSLGGGANTGDNKIDSQCANSQYDEPIPVLYASSTCSAGVIKMALHRAVTHYDNFHRVLVSIIENLEQDKNQKNVELAYQNTGVEALGTHGVEVRVYYDDCVNNEFLTTANDIAAYDLCQGEAGNTIYHRVKIYPLVPKGNIPISAVIGKMEWLYRVDKSIQGKMAINKALMSASTSANLAPGQMQFDFGSDATGDFKNFSIKFSDGVDGKPGNREMMWDANIIRVTKVPGGGSGPGIWTVQGSIKYEKLTLATNPLNSTTYDGGFGHAGSARLYFVAAAEDVFGDGKMLYKSIIADVQWQYPFTGPGIPQLRNFHESRWDFEFHPWATKKKILSHSFSKEHYLQVGYHDVLTNVEVWEREPKPGYLEPTLVTRYTGSVLSRGPDKIEKQLTMEHSHDGTRLLVVNKQDSVINIFKTTRDNWGEYLIEFEGSCEPFGPGVTTSAADFHPQNSDQIVVGNGQPWGDALQTGQVVTLNISNIAMGNCFVEAAKTITLPLMTLFGNQYTRATQFVKYSPDASTIAVVASGRTDMSQPSVFVYNATTLALISSTIVEDNYPISFNADSTKLVYFRTRHDNFVSVIDVATGNKLTLLDDEFANVNTWSAHFNPNHPNLLITARLRTAKVQHWNISSWDPSKG
ncbi:MAG: hypothetical protein OEZ47_16915, partial [Gammaproteobacteria bacterium]|nr:hypothetical protein [Gammaproteobacteria bacterium]